VSANKNRRQSRRDFLLDSLGIASSALAATAVSALGSRSAQAQAAAAGTQNLPHLSPDDPLAKALGYVNEASQTDRAKYPTYKPGQTCEKCRFYQGKAGESWGPCQIYMGKSVDAHGWCASFMVKT
jgi:hypothetical protein